MVNFLTDHSKFQKTAEMKQAVLLQNDSFDDILSNGTGGSNVTVLIH